MEKVVFFEDKDFQGRSYECKGDSTDLHGFLNRCNSVRVESGWWVLYERANYMGYQYIIGPGEYTEYQRWMGFNDCVRSCKVIRDVSGPYKLKLYERPSFDGQTLDVTENMASLKEHCYGHEVQSCKVVEGSWVFFEHPTFRGRQYLLEKGEYRRFSEWGALNATVGSIKRIMEL